MKILSDGPDLNMLIFDSLRADDELSNEVLYEFLSRFKGGFKSLVKVPFLAIISTILSTKKPIFQAFFKQNRIIWTTPSSLSAKNTSIDRTTFDFAMSGK